MLAEWLRTSTKAINPWLKTSTVQGLGENLSASSALQQGESWGFTSVAFRYVIDPLLAFGLRNGMWRELALLYYSSSRTRMMVLFYNLNASHDGQKSFCMFSWNLLKSASYLFF